MKKINMSFINKYLNIIIVINIVLTKTHAQSDYSVWDLGAIRAEEKPDQLKLWVSISARKRFLEISWKNAPALETDLILLTNQEPISFTKAKLNSGTPVKEIDTTEGSGYVQTEEGSGFEGSGYENTISTSTITQPHWLSNNGTNQIVAAIKPSASSQWFTTGVHFDFMLSRNITVNTNCYGYWASYINDAGKILATACIQAHPRWMHDLSPTIAGLRLRDLFIPGTHDSGSYRPNFDPLLRENLVTKYALTQDDDIRGQLMHGVRYLDIRVGYYRKTPDLFYINHGFTRQRPLAEIINQVLDFVEETNEIVIFGLKEFPVGFGKNLSVHRLLVHFLQQRFGDYIVHPSATWSATLRDIWSRHQNVILAYDNFQVVQEFPTVLFGSVEQRWGNVQNWMKLEEHLRNINTFDISRLSSRPIADMAELTPDTWGVILDKHGGLRKMADNVNWRVSQLYRDELGAHANIVAVDFVRGTSLAELAIEFNKRKVSY